MGVFGKKRSRVALEFLTNPMNGYAKRWYGAYGCVTIDTGENSFVPMDGRCYEIRNGKIEVSDGTGRGMFLGIHDGRAVFMMSGCLRDDILEHGVSFCMYGGGSSAYVDKVYRYGEPLKCGRFGMLVGMGRLEMILHRERCVASYVEDCGYGKDGRMAYVSVREGM